MAYSLSAHSRSRGHRGRWILLGLGGVAAAFGAFAFYRSRTRPLGNVAKPVAPSFPVTGVPAPPADPSSLPVSESDSSSGPEPWINPLRQVMEKDPRMLGYDRGAWTAPLLARYLLDTLGLDVPVTQLRKALKDLGYHWKHTHYVQARPVQEQ